MAKGVVQLSGIEQQDIEREDVKPESLSYMPSSARNSIEKI